MLNVAQNYLIRLEPNRGTLQKNFLHTFSPSNSVIFLPATFTFSNLPVIFQSQLSPALTSLSTTAATEELKHTGPVLASTKFEWLTSIVHEFEVVTIFAHGGTSKWPSLLNFNIMSFIQPTTFCLGWSARVILEQTSPASVSHSFWGTWSTCVIRSDHYGRIVGVPACLR